MLCGVVSCEIVLCSVVCCGVLLCFVVSFWRHFLIIFETVLMIVLTFFSYLFLVTFLTFCGSAVKQESGREGLIPHIGGYCVGKSPLSVA